ncbi:MAG: hypothetical protein R3212_07370, partial [Xanthomonadales bacterium]|nr:hypothetical protein [Xanthomonadales bacterium]
RSRQPFKPQTGVKLNHFETVLSFAPAADSGPVVPSSVTSNVSGKAFLVAKIEEDVRVTYTDYEKVD